MSEPKTIYCPQCDRRVGEYDGRSTMKCFYFKCNRCKKRIVYHSDTLLTEVRPLPERASSAGVTFS